MSRMSLGTLTAVLDAEDAKLQKALTQAERGMQRLEKVAKQVAIGAGAAFAGLAGTLAFAARAFDAIESASDRARASIRGSAHAFDERRVFDFAEAMQKATRFADDLILRTQALAIDMGFQQGQTEALTKASADLSTALGMDMNNAMRLLGRSIVEGNNVLSRYGLTMSEAEKSAFDAADAHGRLEIMLGMVEQRFGGLAEEAGQRAAGQFQILRNEVSNVWESFGAIVDSPISAVLARLTQIVATLRGAWEGLEQTTRETIGRWTVGVTVFAGVAAALGATVFVAAKLIPLLKVAALLFKAKAAAALLLATPVLAAIAAVAGLALAVGALKHAWDENMFGIRDTAARVWTWIQDTVGKVTEGMGRFFEGFRNTVAEVFRSVVRSVSSQIRGLLSLLAGAARTLRMTGLADTLERGAAGVANLERVIDRQIDVVQTEGLKAAFAPFIESARDAMSGAGSAIMDGLRASFEGLKSLLPPGLMSIFEGIFGEVEAPSLDAFGAEIEGTIPGLDALGGASRSAVDGLDEFDVAIEQTKRKIRGFGDRLVDGITSSVRGLDRILGAAAEGMAAGGPLTAAAFAGLELLQQSSQFGTLMERVSELLADLADILGSVLEPVIAPLSAWWRVLANLFRGFVPLLQSVTRPMEAIAPLLIVLGDLLAVMAPALIMLNPFFRLLRVGLEALAFVLEHVGRALFWVVTNVGVGILRVFLGLQRAWNAVVGAIQGVIMWIFGGIADLLDSLKKGWGDKVREAGEEMAGSLDRFAADTDKTADAIAALEDLTWDEAMARARGTDAIDDMAEAAYRATDALTNVPRGFRIARARAGAMDPVSVAAGGASIPGLPGGMPGTGTAGMNQVQGGGDYYEINIHEAVDARETARQAVREIERARLGRTGLRHAQAPRFLGGGR